MKQNSFLRFLVIFLAGAFLFTSNSFARELSGQSEISLLTCSPGEELYSLFGHSALRIKDPQNQIDIVFNYGTFDFNTPDFYLKFARGKLKYRLAYCSYERFEPEYIYEGRGIIEQKLNLDLESKRKLFRAILENYKPENRYYSYDFLFDNCSTRIRDIIERNIQGKITYKEESSQSKNFWDLLDFYMEKSRWIYVGIHIILGSQCDIEATPYQYMFLPDNMMYAFNKAEIVKNNENIPLTIATNEVLKPVAKFKRTPWYVSPLFVFGFLAIIGLVMSIVFYRKKRSLYFIDHVVFGMTGLVGWVIIFLWFFTDHQATGPNWNILWALPIYFPLANIVLLKKSKVTYFYFLCSAIIILILLAVWPTIPQSLPNEILPILVLLLIRSLFIVKKTKVKNY